MRGVAARHKQNFLQSVKQGAIKWKCVTAQGGGGGEGGEEEEGEMEEEETNQSASNAAQRLQSGEIIGTCSIRVTSVTQLSSETMWIQFKAVPK